MNVRTGAYPIRALYLVAALVLIILGLTFNNDIVHGRFVNGSFAQGQDHPAIGLWVTQKKRSAVRIEPCRANQPGQTDPLCGYVAWVIDGGLEIDSKNPDPSLRGRSICDLEVMSAFIQNRNNPNKWEDGTIYKADDGDVYKASFEVLDDGRLRVHGYIGIPLFGKTRIWHRDSEEYYPTCKNKEPLYNSKDQ